MIVADISFVEFVLVGGAFLAGGLFSRIFFPPKAENTGDEQDGAEGLAAIGDLHDEIGEGAPVAKALMKRKIELVEAELKNLHQLFAEAPAQHESDDDTQAVEEAIEAAITAAGARLDTIQQKYDALSSDTDQSERKAGPA